jgi:hypothetical protein
LSETGSGAIASTPPASMQAVAPSPVAPYHPPPNYPPSAGSRQVVTDGKAAASLVWAILGLIFGLPLGLPGMIAGPIAYFLGRGALARIAESNGALAGRGAANAGRILGIIATAVGAVVTFVWLIVILNALNDTSTSSSF